MARGRGSVTSWAQGNLPLGRAQNLRVRIALRLEPKIVQVLKIWWDTAQRSAATYEGNASSDTFLFDVLGREDYARCMRSIYCALVDASEMPDMEETIKNDFSSDSHGAETVTSEDFCDAIFEFADACKCRPHNAHK